MEVPPNQSKNPTGGVPRGWNGPGARGQSYAAYRQRRKIILCFDGTGNKFSGTNADSNILKIYGMLDRNNGDKHYYQPGIGTYVNTRSISHTSRFARVHSWVVRTKDSAVGTSFDEHVMGAYKFLMSCYDDDDIYMFGFSRGAYVARFLAEMLDHVGLLSQGNEEMARFAWKAFSQWQEREDGTKEERKKKQEMLEFLQAFRETFSRPIRRIRFLGLFDTVNSVPRFENAWMQRSKFPYTARSSAKIIRHAVSIDERRAKFRQDLISENKASRPREKAHHDNARGRTAKNGAGPNPNQVDRFRRKSRVRPMERSASPSYRPSDPQGRLDPRASLGLQLRSMSSMEDNDASSIGSFGSSVLPPQKTDGDDDADEAAKQDIEELWFPGCHADLGGGYPPANGEEAPLSHPPLVWMVREAQRAGLDFDSEKMLSLNCCDDTFTQSFAPNGSPTQPPMPEIQVTSSSPLFSSPRTENAEPGWAPGLEPAAPQISPFHRRLEAAWSKGVVHDSLTFNPYNHWTVVLRWKFMEYMPFRRMDLRPDGSWKAISLPLPMGEVRDIPEDAHIHHSAIRRMQVDESYRPGNLIIGGGGRGVRRAPKELGIGEWEILKGGDDVVGGVYVRKGESVDHMLDRGVEKSPGVLGGEAD